MWESNFPPHSWAGTLVAFPNLCCEIPILSCIAREVSFRLTWCSADMTDGGFIKWLETKSLIFAKSLWVHVGVSLFQHSASQFITNSGLALTFLFLCWTLKVSQRRALRPSQVCPGQLYDTVPNSRTMSELLQKPKWTSTFPVACCSHQFSHLKQLRS